MTLSICCISVPNIVPCEQPVVTMRLAVRASKSLCPAALLRVFTDEALALAWLLAKPKTP